MRESIQKAMVMSFAGQAELAGYWLLQGKMSRVLAAKCALSIRVDAMGDSPEPTIGLESRQMVSTLPQYLTASRNSSCAAAGAVGKPHVHGLSLFTVHVKRACQGEQVFSRAPYRAVRCD